MNLEPTRALATVVCVRAVVNTYALFALRQARVRVNFWQSRTARTANKRTLEKQLVCLLGGSFAR